MTLDCRSGTEPAIPRLRGVMHQYGAVLGAALAVVLVELAPSARARTAAVVYGTGLCACLGMSAIYHRGRWSPRVKATLCRVDHATIFLLIAGTSTAVILLTLRGSFGTTMLILEWAGAAAGIGSALLWRGPPVWAEVAPYLVLGWLGLLALPALGATMGPLGLALALGGGVLYTIGTACYAMERPNPWPAVFGFHEVFHGFVTAAASVHGALVALLILAA